MKVVSKKFAMLIVNPLNDRLIELSDTLDKKIRIMFESIETRFKLELCDRDNLIVDLTTKLNNVLEEREIEKSELADLREKISSYEAKPVIGTSSNDSHLVSGWTNTNTEKATIF